MVFVVKLSVVILW